MRWLKAATLRKIRYRRKVLGGGDSKLRSGFPFVQLNTDLEKKLLEVASLELADRGGVTGVILCFRLVAWFGPVFGLSQQER